MRANVRTEYTRARPFTRGALCVQHGFSSPWLDAYSSQSWRRRRPSAIPMRKSAARSPTRAVRVVPWYPSQLVLRFPTGGTARRHDATTMTHVANDGSATWPRKIATILGNVLLATTISAEAICSIARSNVVERFVLTVASGLQVGRVKHERQVASLPVTISQGKTAPSCTCLVIDQFGTSRLAPPLSTLKTSAIVDSVQNEQPPSIVDGNLLRSTVCRR